MASFFAKARKACQFTRAELGRPLGNSCHGGGRGSGKRFRDRSVKDSRRLRDGHPDRGDKGKSAPHGSRKRKTARRSSRIATPAPGGTCRVRELSRRPRRPDAWTGRARASTREGQGERSVPRCGDARPRPGEGVVRRARRATPTCFPVAARSRTGVDGLQGRTWVHITERLQRSGLSDRSSVRADSAGRKVWMGPFSGCGKRGLGSDGDHLGGAFPFVGDHRLVRVFWGWWGWAGDWPGGAARLGWWWCVRPAWAGADGRGVRPGGAREGRAWAWRRAGAWSVP